MIKKEISYLVLVKHSLPEVLPDVLAKQWHLSEKGRLRCKMLAEKIAFYKPNIVMSRLGPKAVEIAVILSEHSYVRVPFMEKFSFASFTDNVLRLFAREEWMFSL